jgi:hypothetical protein
MLRTRGEGNLWVIERIITYDGRPVYTVSVIVFKDGKIAHETYYFDDPLNRLNGDLNG